MTAPARATLDAIRDWLPWLAVMGLFVPSAFGAELGPHAERFLDRHGVSVVIILAGLAYVPRLVRAHQQLAGAIQDSAAAIQRLADHDDYRHREVLGVLNVLAEDMRGAKEELRRMRREFDGDGR